MTACCGQSWVKFERVPVCQRRQTVSTEEMMSMCAWTLSSSPEPVRHGVAEACFFPLLRASCTAHTICMISHFACRRSLHSLVASLCEHRIQMRAHCLDVWIPHWTGFVQTTRSMATRYVGQMMGCSGTRRLHLRSICCNFTPSAPRPVGATFVQHPG